jgi:hypothetical protein
MPIKPQVQISLTKEQYKTLVEMTYLGHWMINAIRTKRIKKYDEMEQLVFSFTKQAGLLDCIDYDDKLKMFFPLADFEENDVLPFKEEYDDYTFWDELAHRLAERDMLAKHGTEALEKMPRDDRFALQDNLVAEYEAEFTENGVDGLVLEAPAAPQS